VFQVHSLRADINELAELLSTHTVWCVNSVISGDFDQRSFGRLMSIVDLLLEFIYTPEVRSGGAGAGHASGLSEGSKGDANEHDDPSAALIRKKKMNRSTSSSGLVDTARRLTKKVATSVTGTRSTVVFITALRKYFMLHPQHGDTDVAQCEHFFLLMDSLIEPDGILEGDLAEFSR
jgi:hypothetical protein